MSPASLHQYCSDQDVCPGIRTREVLCHEMVHQYVEEVLGICEELPHGEAFKRVCQERELIQRLRVTFKAGWKSAKTDSP